MKKIENIIESCAVCRHCGSYARRDGERRRATVCEKAARMIALAAYDEVMNATIPDWCPLETYEPDAQPAPTVELCGLEWMAEPLRGYGGTEIDGRYYYTQDEAIEAARRVGNGWRLPTKEEFCALAVLGGTWDKARKGCWFGARIFFEASGYRASNSGGLFSVGANGYSWSSSPSSSSSVNGSNLSFNSGRVNPENYSNRALGFPVRCVRNRQ